MEKKDNHSKEEDALLEALSPIINKLIDKNYETSKDKIASQMAPLIGSAIREQIKSQKDDIVDALYPVMGNMISRYVSKSLEEMLETINAKIQNGLSFEALKRKITAKLKGVSETELLLQQSSESNIKAILLIHKESGVVLAQLHKEDSKIDEPEMVASMMSAIRSFVNDWIEKNEKNSEIGEIDYGGSKIVIENGGYSYMAVIIDGAIYNKTLDKIRKTLEKIILEYGQSIRAFNGNLSDFPQKQIQNIMQPLLKTDSNTKDEKKKIHPLIYIIPILFILFLTQKGYMEYHESKLQEKANQILYKTPQLTVYRIDAKLKDGIIILNGEVPSKEHKRLAQKRLENLRGIKGIQNELQVVQTDFIHKKTDDNEVRNNIKYYLDTLNSLNGYNINFTYKNNILTLQGEVWDSTRKAKVLESIKNIPKIEKIIEKITIKLPKIETIVYFDNASCTLNMTEEKKLVHLSKTLQNIDNNITLSIKGYSDSKGTKSSRKKIALKRAKHLKKLLKEKFLLKQKMAIDAKDALPKEIKLKKGIKNARCCIINTENQEM